MGGPYLGNSCLCTRTQVHEESNTIVWAAVVLDLLRFKQPSGFRNLWADSLSGRPYMCRRIVLSRVVQGHCLGHIAMQPVLSCKGSKVGICSHLVQLCRTQATRVDISILRDCAADGNPSAFQSIHCRHTRGQVENCRPQNSGSISMTVGPRPVSEVIMNRSSAAYLCSWSC